MARYPDTTCATGSPATLKTTWKFLTPPRQSRERYSPPSSGRECSSRLRHAESVATAKLYPAGSVSCTFTCFCTQRSRHVVGTRSNAAERTQCSMVMPSVRPYRRTSNPAPPHGSHVASNSSTVSSIDSVIPPAPSPNTPPAPCCLKQLTPHSPPTPPPP